MLAYLSSRRGSIVSLLTMVASLATAVAGLDVIPHQLYGLSAPPLVVLLGPDLAPRIVAGAIVVAAVFGTLATFGPSPRPVIPAPPAAPSGKEL